MKAIKNHEIYQLGYEEGYNHGMRNSLHRLKKTMDELESERKNRQKRGG